MILLLLKFLADKLECSHMSGCKELSRDLGEVFRLDASAKGQEVCVGGWLSAEGRSTKEAPWFSVVLTRKNAPWTFARGEPFRTIATLKLLGALLGMMVLLPVENFDRALAATLSQPSGTSSQVAGFSSQEFGARTETMTGACPSHVASSMPPVPTIDDVPAAMHAAVDWYPAMG